MKIYFYFAFLFISPRFLSGRFSRCDCGKLCKAVITNFIFSFETLADYALNTGLPSPTVARPKLRRPAAMQAVSGRGLQLLHSEHRVQPLVLLQRLYHVGLVCCVCLRLTDVCVCVCVCVYDQVNSFGLLFEASCFVG